jgi:hypothetical protein
MYTIGVWGPSAAGKTAYLSQLYLQLQDSPWTVFPTAAAEPFLQAAREYFDRNEFPPATSINTQDVVAYALRSTDDVEYFLALTDRPGVVLTNLERSLRDELNAADALMLLLDSQDDPQRLGSALDAVLSALHASAERGTARDGRAVAVCFTKVDRLLTSVAELELAVGDPDRFVRSRIGDRLDMVASRFLDRYRFFPVSAAGVFVGDGVVEPATFYDEAFRLRLASGGRAVNLVAPFTWVAEQLSREGIR